MAKTRLAACIFDQAGNLYGTTFDGGINGGGTVYELSPSGGGWTFATIYSFTAAMGDRLQQAHARQGDPLRLTNAEGANGLGSVFKLARSNGAWTLPTSTISLAAAMAGYPTAA